MIDVFDNKNCCGCNACVQTCPEKCIALKIDNEGFEYPVVDNQTCINCGLCEDVCPMLHCYGTRDSIQIIAARNKNEELRLLSSSGGMFSVLAENILNQSGVVFGAKMDDELSVVHDFTLKVDELKHFRGSKYVQSQINDSYIKVREFLNKDRLVLFSGTPCQVRGLSNFLGREYKNLLLVDFICHGVSSPGIFKQFINQTLRKKSDLKYTLGKLEISFRDKTNGWHNFGMVLKNKIDNSNYSKIVLDKKDTDVFFSGYGSNLFLRPSCHNCPSKNLSSCSDLTLADFWGIEDIYPDFDDDKGSSLVLINSIKGETILNATKENYESFPVDPKTVLKRQTALFNSVKPSKYREVFFKADNSVNLINNIINFGSKRSMVNSNYLKVKDLLIKVGFKKLYHIIKR